MSFTSVATRKFHSELNSLLNRKVFIRTINGKTYEGVLLGYDDRSLHVCLGDVKDEKGVEYTRVIISGNVISEILSQERLIDLRELAERIERVFPHMVKYIEDAKVILVMDRIKVTEDGVVEGSGPAAERVRKIYEEYVMEKKSRSNK
ncbi:MAG: Lsm family RNA-binding protein [Thermoprotei archaeon]|nr:Lsm family RNA-binding protein [Thermoprotei archaeon]